MKMKKLAGVCLLIPILLTGCGSKADTQTAAAGTSQPQQTAKPANGQGQNRPAMDPAQMKLFSTFQTLMMLDRADGLTITKEQAQAMLPIAQDVVTKKELSDENKTKLLATLTDAQKTFITDAETRMSNRGNGGPGGNGSGGPNGQGRNGEGQGRGNGGGAAGQGQGQGQGQAPGASASPNANAGNAQQGGGNRQNGGGNGGGGFNGNRPAGGQMGNIAEAFVELLQTKLK
ncbi:hypothetical protein [Paenibacillus roseipurpureus]|uniref:Lipoprotein n=1 Tax=Paenibacillus roseopurpureus TaxID=2918901 RepID=A0AA96RK82_9BACL|nr:hypothetical protein [Paenibacillus sp. MBLB1832]WNR44016.1 hypothetical protein MJB10_23445 [Paenibacillus sp. MBLB1832]